MNGMIQSKIHILAGVAALFLLLSLFPLPTEAATQRLEISGWVPYWQDSEGIRSARKNIRDIDTINPFVYSVRSDGTIAELSDLGSSEWRSFLRYARRKDIEVVPTIMWSNGAQIHGILSDTRKRHEHIKNIVELVDDGNFDGIDIDYESKLAETIDYFSLFLEELKEELGRDLLTCTVEARTPPESLYRTVPAVIEYANDYSEIGKHCDRVEIMAYDQQRVDWRLNSEKNGEPYIPVADEDWVEKVVKFALNDIDPDKIMLGVPTYGREWELTVEPEWYKEYKNVQAVNLPDALDIAKENDVRPGENRAGEQSFSYFPETSVFKLLEVLPVPKGTRRGFEAAAQALLFANATDMTVPVRVVWYSDADAIEDKIDIAKKYDLRGIAIFKIDGEEDEDIWDLF